MRTINPQKILVRFADNAELPEVFAVRLATVEQPTIVLARSLEEACDLCIARHAPQAESIDLVQTVLVQTVLGHAPGLSARTYQIHQIDRTVQNVTAYAQPLQAIAAKDML